MIFYSMASNFLFACISTNANRNGAGFVVDALFNIHSLALTHTHSVYTCLLILTKHLIQTFDMNNSAISLITERKWLTPFRMFISVCLKEVCVCAHHSKSAFKLNSRVKKVYWTFQIENNKPIMQTPSNNVHLIGNKSYNFE